MRRPVLALLATGLLLAACGGSESTRSGGKAGVAPEATAAVDTAPAATSPDGTTAAPDTAAGDTRPDVEAPTALQFTAPAVGGGEIDFTRYAGRPVVLWFWAPT